MAGAGAAAAAVVLGDGFIDLLFFGIVGVELIELAVVGAVLVANAVRISRFLPIIEVPVAAAAAAAAAICVEVVVV